MKLYMTMEPVNPIQRYSSEPTQDDYISISEGFEQKIKQRQRETFV